MWQTGLPNVGDYLSPQDSCGQITCSDLLYYVESQLFRKYLGKENVIVITEAICFLYLI